MDGVQGVLDVWSTSTEGILETATNDSMRRGRSAQRGDDKTTRQRLIEDVQGVPRCSQSMLGVWNEHSGVEKGIGEYVQSVMGWDHGREGKRKKRVGDNPIYLPYLTYRASRAYLAILSLIQRSQSLMCLPF
jgi:hypothetical protein